LAGEGFCVQSDQFLDRLDAVRRRFAASLDGKIKDTYAELPGLTGEGADVVDAVAASYRRIHGICGVGAAVGFVGTGRAAKAVEDVLVGPYHSRRGLAADEVACLKDRLTALSAAAQAELGPAVAPPNAKHEG
jgi:hypothetical protein